MKFLTLSYIIALTAHMRGANVKNSLLDAASGTPAFYPGNKYIDLDDDGSGNEVVPELEAGRLVRLSDVWSSGNRGFGLQYARATDGNAAFAVTTDDYSLPTGEGDYFTASNQFDQVLSVALLTKGMPVLVEAGDAWTRGATIYQGENGVGVATAPATNAIRIGKALEAVPAGQAGKLLPDVQDINPAALAGTLIANTIAEGDWDDEVAIDIPAGCNLIAVFLGGALQALGTDYTIVAGQVVPTGAAWDSADATPLVFLCSQ